MLIVSLLMFKSCSLEGQQTFPSYFLESENFEFVFPAIPEVNFQYSADSVLISESMILFDQYGEIALGHVVSYNIDEFDTRMDFSRLKGFLIDEFDLPEKCEMANFDRRKNSVSFTMSNGSAMYLLKHREIEGYHLTSICRGSYVHYDYIDSLRIHPMPILFEIQFDELQIGQKWYVDIETDNSTERHPVTDSDQVEITVSEFHPYTLTICSDHFVSKTILVNPTGNLSSGLANGYRIPFGVHLMRKDDKTEPKDVLVGELHYDNKTGYMRWK